MPSIVTHRLMADDVFALLGDGYVKKAIEQHYDLFSIASSGPDIFFFYQPLKWLMNQKTIVNSYGGWMHTMHTNDMFEIMLKIAWAKRNPKHMAYVAGLVCHWAMDSKAHPYVYSRCGKGTSENGILHRDMESTIDLHLLQQKGLKLKEFKPTDIVKHEKYTYLPIYELYQPVLLECFGAELEKSEMKKALHDFHTAQEVLYDPYGIKRSSTRLVEKIAGQKGSASGMVIPRKDKLRYDVMNEAHLEWVHPCTNEPHHESFMDLYAQAIERATGVLREVDDYMNSTGSIEQVLDLIGNRNFSTGLSEQMEMKYFSILQEHL